MATRKGVSKAIITDAGDGTRCLPFTKTAPKGQLPVGGLDSAIDLIARECIAAGLDVILVVRPCDLDSYMRYYQDYDSELMVKLSTSGKHEQIDRLNNLPRLTIVTQDENLPYGNAAPIITCLELLEPDEPVVVCYGDDIVIDGADVLSLMGAYAKYDDADGIIMGKMIDESQVNKFGMIKLKNDARHLLDEIHEKPAIGEQPSCLASYGRYLLGPKILQALARATPGKDNEIWTVDAITQVAKTGRVYVQESSGEWVTTGNEDGYVEAFVYQALLNAYRRLDVNDAHNLSRKIDAWSDHLYSRVLDRLVMP